MKPSRLLKRLRIHSVFIAVCLAISFASQSIQADDASRPNVIVIMSDDQGVGDYGFMGNPIIRTPSLDELRTRSGLLSRFYVSSVCAPTRASLMTGRYNYRTRCIDTYLGRAMMDPAEVTLAECLTDAGYRTGIFGKWHLGDNYPMRPMDQGFHESLIHRGGGIGQPSDPIGAEGKYTDPTLIHNGEEVAMKGYCTDLFFDAAIEFIGDQTQSQSPFFTYIATNAPHGPFHDVPERLYDEYKDVDFSPILVSDLPDRRRNAEFDKLARIAAMITNIDENVGKLMKALGEMNQLENTIVLYLNDNGPNSKRFVGNMRGSKTQVDDGGIRSPLLFHWPAKVKAGTTVDVMTAHIDLMPTLLEACQANVPAGTSLDGKSFLPWITGKRTADDWKQRQIVFQTHRGNVPQRFHHFAIHEHPWKLVHPSGFGKENFEGSPDLELYHLEEDPKQQHNLAVEKPELVGRLKVAYEKWFEDVSSTRPDNYAPPRIVIGTDHEPESVLTRQDWRHESGRPWSRNSTGFWLLQAPAQQKYEVELVLTDDQHSGGSAILHVDDEELMFHVRPNARRGHTVKTTLPSGPIRLSVSVDKSIDAGVHQVILRRSDRQR
ncbi:arylsulfatase [Rhodopirellula sp. JC740]|uniref:Arylsulfatase n=1 Tax=Rhodopirellula halodulae TaxID=2894198 RepID=A0ABS8NI49_9BACT|nr:arylsulfatase [Rhodopirellula sp. JC740]MCC9643242.1 arylsulfatase [Rhodopirellula sp. JC740]